MTLVSELLLLVLLASAVVGQTSLSQRRAVFRNDAADGDGTIVTTQYSFPGLVQSYWWLGDLLIAHSNGHLFGCRDFCGSGDWESWTEHVPTFVAPPGSSQRARGIGTVTSVVIPPAGHALDGVLPVETLSGTFLLATTKGGVRVVGNFSLDAPLIEAPQPLPDAPAMVAPAIYAGQPVTFAELYLSPTEKGVAAAVMRTPGCHSLTITCRRYLFVSHPAFSLPADPLLAHWRQVLLPVDVHRAFFGSPLASPYDPARLFLFTNAASFASDPFGGEVVSMDVTAFASESHAVPPVKPVLGRGVIQVAQDAKFMFFISTGTAGSLLLYVSDRNAETPPILATFGSHLFEGDAEILPAKGEGEAPGDSDGETGYSVVDTSDNVFVNVYRGTRDFQQMWGHTFASGLGGLRYAAVLRYNRRHPATGQVDFHRVQGLDGVIIANIVTNPEDGICRFCRTMKECDENCLFGTVLSRDNGQTWQRLTLEGGCPSVADDTEPPGEGGFGGRRAENECSLHLHGASSGSALTIVSSSFAPGVVIATGNPGDFLDVSPNGPRNVYISRDAGDSWEQLLTGPSWTDMTDYGGLIWGLPSGRRTAHLNYTIDEGETWTFAKFLPPASGSYLFSTVVPTKGFPRAKFLIALGFADDGSSDAAFTIDLSQLKDRPCHGMETPSDAQSDFEVFLPSSYYSEKGVNCFMGRVAAYTRKRYGAKCWVPPLPADATSLELPKLISVCNCTYDDYECDVGYVRQGAMCVVDDSVARPATCSPQGYREVLTGYRRLPNDRCAGALDLDPTIEACVQRDSLAAGYLSLLALALMALCFLVHARYRSDEAFKKLVQSLPMVRFFIGGGRRSVYRSVPRAEDDAENDHEDDDDHAEHTTLVAVEAPGPVDEREAPVEVCPGPGAAPQSASPEPRERQTECAAEPQDAPEEIPNSTRAQSGDNNARITEAATGELHPHATVPTAASDLDDLFSFVPSKSASPGPQQQAKVW